MSLRLAKKGRKQKQRETQSTFDQELAVARRERDEGLHASNRELEKDIAAARDENGKRRKAIHDAYDEIRNDVVKRAAAAS